MSDDPDAGAFRPPRFDVTVSEAQDAGAVVVRVTGELDIVSEPEFEAALKRIDGRAATVDLSGVAFMDSTGLRALIGAARSYPGLKLSGPLQPPVRRLLELTQTLTILPFENV